MTAARIRIVAPRLPGEASRLSPFVVGSLLAHVAVSAVLILLPGLLPKKKIVEAPIVVDLVAAPRTAPRMQTPTPPAAAPKSDPVPTRPPQEPEPLPERVEPARKPKAPEPEPQPIRRPPAPAATDATDDPAPGEATSGGETTGGETTGSAVSAVLGGDSRFAWYRSAVTAALYSHWRRPVLQGMVEPVEVRVSFEILRNGSVRGVAIEQSSGIAVFDRSALRAVHDAAPLPALPGAWREPTLPATFLFQLFPE